MNESTTETAPTAGAPLAARRGRPYTPVHGGQDEVMSGPAAMETAARAGSRREPLGRAERILTTLLAALLGSVIVGFVTIGGQLISMQRQMHEEIGGLRGEMREEIGTLRNEMRTEIGELSDRMARIETLLQIHHGPLPGS